MSNVFRRFNQVIESNIEPSNKNDIWLNKGRFCIYYKGEWTPITLNLEDASNVLNFIENNIDFIIAEIEKRTQDYAKKTEVAEEYATKTDVTDAVADKVDKVDGKQLTTEDFTTALKEKLQGLNNYDDAEVKAAIEKLRGDFDTLVAGDTSAAIKSFNDIVAFLEGIEDSESLDSIIASIEQQIAGKQDEISDLETIRQGAAKGATALQEIPAALVEKTNAYDVDEQGRIFIKGVAGYDGTDKAEKHSLQSYLAFIENAVLSIYPQGSFSKAFSPAFSGGKITY
jgi:hypothetical protein